MNGRHLSSTQQWAAGMAGPLAGAALVALLRDRLAWSQAVVWYILLVVTSLLWMATLRRVWGKQSRQTTLQEASTALAYAVVWGAAMLLPEASDDLAVVTVLLFLAIVSSAGLVVHALRTGLFLATQGVLSAFALFGLLRATDTYRLGMAITIVLASVASLAAHGALLRFVLATFDSQARLAELQAQAESANRVLMAANEDLAYKANHDQLTGLANRGIMMDTLGRQIAAIRESSHGLAVLYLDIDHFKDVNDQHGHAAGDRLLGLIAKRLQGSVRPGDLVARLGGDEMACILPGVTESESEQLAKRLLQRATTAVHFDQTETYVGLSIGLAWTNAPTADPTDLLHRADQALYEAKRAGRNRIAVAAPMVAE